METSFDIWDDMPKAQKKYLSNYGWNFNKKAYEFAVNGMKKWDGSKLSIVSKETFYDIMSKNGVSVDNDNGYNGTYTYMMSIADYYGRSIDDEKHLCMHVKSIIDDIDNKGGNVFRKWYADCVAKGVVINWEDIFE